MDKSLFKALILSVLLDLRNIDISDLENMLYEGEKRKMRMAIKKEQKIIKAYELGKETAMEKRLIEEEKIMKKSDKIYEIFSQEAVNGRGEISKKGDFFKLDSSRYPYPNSREFFFENHQIINEEKNEYIQKVKPIQYYIAEDGMTEELKFLIEKKGLVIDKKSYNRYYTAFLWESNLSAAKDAVLVFYNIVRNTEGKIEDIEFNFVERNEFDKTYEKI